MRSDKVTARGPSPQVQWHEHREVQGNQASVQDVGENSSERMKVTMTNFPR